MALRLQQKSRMNYEMQRRDKWILPQHLPSVLQDPSAGWLRDEGLCGTHKHLHSARPGTASLLPCRQGNPLHPVQHIRGLANTEEHWARKASARSISAHFPVCWALELLEGWELETSRRAGRRRPGKVTKSFPGLLWAGCEEVMTTQDAGRATSPLGKRCQGHGRHYHS